MELLTIFFQNEAESYLQVATFLTNFLAQIKKN